jgi:hypothetical protein
MIYSMGEDALACAVEAVGAATLDGALPVGAEAGLPLVRFPLEDTAAAHDAVEKGIIGKVLIDVPLRTTPPRPHLAQGSATTSLVTDLSGQYT